MRRRPPVHCKVNADANAHDGEHLGEDEDEQRADVEDVEKPRLVGLDERLERQRRDENRKRHHDLQVWIAQQRAGERDEELAEHHDERLPRHDDRAALRVVPGDQKPKALAEARRAKAPRCCAAYREDPCALEVGPFAFRGAGRLIGLLNRPSHAACKEVADENRAETHWSAQAVHYNPYRRKNQIDNVLPCKRAHARGAASARARE